jgi:hypothetical protein
MSVSDRGPGRRKLLPGPLSPSRPVATMAAVDSVLRQGAGRGGAPPVLAPPTGRREAIAGAVIANVLPVIGILLLQWDLLPVVFYYLLESVVIGAFALLKIRRCVAVSDDWRPDAAGVSDLSAMPSRERLVLRLGGIVLVEVIVLFALWDGAMSSGVAWVSVALVVLVGQGIVTYRRQFVRERRFISTTCAEVEVDFLFTFAVFLAMVAVLAALGSLGLGDDSAATIAVLLLVVARGAVDVWRATGRDSRHLRRIREYAEHLAALDAGVEGRQDE